MGVDEGTNTTTTKKVTREVAPTGTQEHPFSQRLANTKKFLIFLEN